MPDQPPSGPGEPGASTTGGTGSGLPWLYPSFLALNPEQSSLETASVVLIPVPYDSTTSYRGGARDRGPDTAHPGESNLGVRGWLASEQLAKSTRRNITSRDHGVKDVFFRKCITHVVDSCSRQPRRVGANY